MNEKTVWVAGQVINDELGQWEIIGVFSDEEKAVSACREPTDFVGPVKLDAIYPRESIDWAGAYYPVQLDWMKLFRN